jgi:DNA-binding SARP family transcriptional activator/tetratricopeptide (TPR) repeat protein
VDVQVDLMGRFCVSAGPLRLGPDDWPVRRAAELVALLALADGHRLNRDQVVDALWPRLEPGAGAANLRKAAHHARRALAAPDAVVLRGGQVSLFPSRTVTTDVGAFEAAAAAALRSADPQACADAAARYGGELLPAARYQEWAHERREHLRTRYVRVLRTGGAWEQLLQVEPADEPAHCALMREALDRKDPHAALRWFGRLRTVLEQDVGVRPGREAQALYAACVEGLRPAAPTLLGRHVELARAELALRGAAAGETTVLVVRGPGGIGKTALCTALTAVAREHGWVAVPVQALADAGPYAPLVDAVEHVLQRQPSLVAAVSARTRSVLAELTPLLLGSPPLDGPVSRHQVVGAVRQVLLAAGGGAPIALVVDDAHLTDDDTATALVHLAGTGGTGRLLVVLAHRPAPDRTSLLDGLARLERAGRSVTVDLAPLSRDDAAALVVLASPERPSADRLARVVDRAAGNPFFLLELAAEPAAAAGGSSGSESLWDAVRHRLVDVDEPTRAAVQRLAVVGGELDSAVVVALTGLAEPDALAVLDDAMAAGLLVLHGARYAFRHDLVRQALVAQVPPHRRAAIHRDAATRLGQSGASPHAVARLWLAGERPQEAVPWLAAAAREAVRLGAFHDALSTLDVLLQHAPGHAAALRLRAGALEAVGDARAPAAFAAAALAVPADQRSDLRARQALASIRAGDPAGALAALDGVEARTLEGRLAQSLALAGAAAMGHGDPSVGVVRAAETRRLAIESGDPSAVVIASWAEAAAAHAKGELPGVLRAGLRETWALPEVAITTFDGHLCVAERLLYGGQPYDDVIAFADALEAEADRLGAARGRAFATTFRGEARLLTGDLVGASADLERGVALHRAIGASGGASLALERLAQIAVHRGDRPGAVALLDDALVAARDSGLGFHLFDRIYGARITVAADPTAALAAVEEAEASVQGALETCPGCRITLAVPAALAAADAGDLQRARRYESVAEELTTLLMRLPGWYAALDEVRGHLARAEGDVQAAGRHLRAAAERFRAAGQPLDSDRCSRDAVLLT